MSDLNPHEGKGGAYVEDPKSGRVYPRGTPEADALLGIAKPVPTPEKVRMPKGDADAA